MRYLSVLILSVISFSACAGNILVLGDSLSAAYGMPAERGWVQLLQNRLDDNMSSHQVVNASISGDTTQGGLNRLPGLLQRYQPELVVIELGGNDGLRGTPPARIAANLEQLVSLAQQRQAKVLLLGMQLPPNYGPAYNARFSAMYKNISDKTGASLVPFFMARVALRPELMQADGIHPNAAAQPLLLETVWPRLNGMLP